MSVPSGSVNDLNTTELLLSREMDNKNESKQEKNGSDLKLFESLPQNIKQQTTPI